MYKYMWPNLVNAVLTIIAMPFLIAHLRMTIIKTLTTNIHRWYDYKYIYYIYFLYYMYILSASIGNWSLVDGNSQPLPDVSDGYSHTCYGLTLEDRPMLLKSDLNAPFKTLQVTLLIAGGEILFFPNTDLARCKKPVSLLMTHDSTLAQAIGQICEPFCEVPVSCRLDEMIILATDVRDYTFTCVCPLDKCNELLMWFQPQTVQSRISICEVSLAYPWIESWVYH